MIQRSYKGVLAVHFLMSTVSNEPEYLHAPRIYP